MSQPTYRIAFIGCGRRAVQHVDAVQSDARCHVVALSDLNQEAAAALNAEGHFDAPIYNDHRLMLERERPDAVILCLWTPLHLPVFRDCVQAGVRAVLSEKPMAPTWNECLQMHELAQQSKTQLTFCHQRRFAKANLEIRRLINEGALGEIKRLDLYAPSDLLDCGTHTIDQALSFIGESPAKWVMGAIDISNSHLRFGVPGECMATATIAFGNGVRANLQVGGPDMDLWGGVRVIGTQGFIAATWSEIVEGRIYNNPQWQLPQPKDGDGEHMRGVVSHALDCLESGAEPEISSAKALRAAEIIFGIYESARRRARVELPLQNNVTLESVLQPQ
jgi:UDP-N-acetyl-2-amino-2-deoxyglucuronate dehydrogenase